MRKPNGFLSVIGVLLVVIFSAAFADEKELSIESRKKILLMVLIEAKEEKAKLAMDGIDDLGYVSSITGHAATSPENAAAMRGFTRTLQLIRQRSKHHNLPTTGFDQPTPYLNGKLGKQDVFHLCETNVLAIHLAVEGNHAETVKWLAAQGDNLNVRTSFFAPPGWRECLKSPKNLTANGAAPLESAMPHPEMVKLLFELGADAHTINTETGDTPLHYAFLLHRNEGIPLASAKLLVNAGVDLQHKNKLGMTVFDAAAMFPASESARWITSLKQ